MKIALKDKGGNVRVFNLPKKSVDFLYSYLKWRALPESERKKTADADINQNLYMTMISAQTNKGHVYRTSSGDEIALSTAFRLAHNANTQVRIDDNIKRIEKSLRLANGSTPEYETFRMKRNAEIDERIKKLEELHKRAMDSVKGPTTNDQDASIPDFHTRLLMLRQKIKELNDSRPRDFLQEPKAIGFFAFFRNLIQSEASRSMERNNKSYSIIVNELWKGNEDAVEKNIQKINTKSASDQLKNAKQSIAVLQKKPDASQLSTPPTNASAKPVFMSGVNSNVPSKPAMVAVAPTVQSTIAPERLERYREAADKFIKIFEKKLEYPVSKVEEAMVKDLRKTFDEYLTTPDENSLNQFKNTVSDLSKSIGEDNAQAILEGLDKPKIKPKT